MTEQALDKLARRVMLDAARLEYGGLPEEPHIFSPAFERKMKKLLRRGRHPAWHRALHAAACLLLALLLSGCAVLAVSAEAREVFAGWVREVYETSFIYRFSGVERTTAEDGFTTYRPTYIPSGFQMRDEFERGEVSSVTYENDGDGLAVFNRLSDTMTPVFQIERDGTETYQRVLVNGMPAELYLDQDEGENHVLLWTDETKASIFCISGLFDKAELLKMAESIEPVRLVYSLGWVPEGYVLYERSFLHSKESATTIYENPKGEFLIFRCQRNEDDIRLYLAPNEGSVGKRVFVNDHPADLYSNPEPGRISELCWSDGEAFYYLSGDLSDEEILKMAGSVQKLPPIPATHIPTWLPLGYRDTSTSSGLWSIEAEYENEAGEQLQFRFARHGQVEEPMKECLAEIREALAGLEGQETTVDGCPGRLYLGGSVNHLLWGVEGGEEVYWLSGPLDEEALLETARGVHREAE